MIINTTNEEINTDAEELILGMILLDDSQIEKIADDLKPDYFMNHKNKKIYEKMLALNQEELPINISVLASDKSLMESEAKITIEYLTKITSQALIPADIEKVADHISRLYIHRSLQNIGREIIGNKNPINIYEEIEFLEQKIFNLAAHGSYGHKFINMQDASDSMMQKIKSSFEHKKILLGDSTGFEDLDKMLGGMQKSDLIIIAGRPSMGKTALAVNIAHNACLSFLKEQDPNSSVGFFSLEMSSEQLITRILSIKTGINSFKIRSGMINDSEFGSIINACNELKKLNLFIDDSAALSISSIKSRARRLHRKHNMKVLFIDYLQLIAGNRGQSQDSRVQQISEITQGLKSIAKELDIAVIALSQLSRAVEQREDKRPQLSDLRESGSIEQDSDVVMFVYREEYYIRRTQPKEGTDAHKEWQNKMDNIMNQSEVIIAKQRNGPVGNIKLFFDSNSTEFKNFYDER